MKIQWLGASVAFVSSLLSGCTFFYYEPAGSFSEVYSYHRGGGYRQTRSVGACQSPLGGSIYVVGTNYDSGLGEADLFILRSDDDGASWTRYEHDTLADPEWAEGCGVDADGRLVVFYEDNTPDVRVVFSSDGGETLSAPVNPPSDSGNETFMNSKSNVISFAGDVYAVAVDSTIETLLVYKVEAGSTAVSIVESVNVGNPIAGYIASHSNTLRLHAVSNNVLYESQSSNGSSWSAPNTIGDVTSNSFFFVTPFLNHILYGVLNFDTAPSRGKILTRTGSSLALTADHGHSSGSYFMEAVCVQPFEGRAFSFSTHLVTAFNNFTMHVKSSLDGSSWTSVREESPILFSSANAYKWCLTTADGSIIYANESQSFGALDRATEIRRYEFR